MKEIFKLIVVSAEYFAIAPLLGLVLARSRIAQRAALCLLVFMTSWYPSKLTLMVDSMELYRGHTKGFEFSLMVVVGIALLVAAWRDQVGRTTICPPGLWLYLLFCVAGCFSIFAAQDKVLVLMAGWKFTTAALIFIGTFCAFRDGEDLRWVLRSISATLALQALICLKLRYFDSRWQVHGWFEHQNPMAIWAYLLAIPLLAVAFAPETTRRDTLIYLGGAASAALMILLSVSRAGLAAFALGCILVAGLACLRGLSAKKIGIIGIGACAALAAGMLALDSLMMRVHENDHADRDEDLRGILNVQSKQMLHDSVFGIGWNNFGLANSLPNGRYAQTLMDWDQARGFRIIDDNYYANPLTESLYWLLLAETGYPGFIAYVAFLALTLWWVTRGLIRHWRSPLGYFLGGLLVALILMYLHGTVERVLTQTKNYSAWLIFAGIAARIQAAHVTKKTAKAPIMRAPSNMPALAT